MATLFHEVLFPEAIAIASDGGPEWVTEVVRTSGGAEQRIQRYARALHRFRVAHVWRTRAEFATLLAFFHARRGRAYGFRVRDWGDYAAVVGEGIMGDDGIGTGYPTYQLVKRYDDAALPYLRPIQKPRSATVIGYRNSGVITQGSADGNISVDYTTGIITFVKDSQVGNVSITAGASTTVSVPSDQSWQIGQYVYLTGVGGADAALLNNLAHKITNITGSSPWALTVATDTAGKTVSGGIGTNSWKYPQPFYGSALTSATSITVGTTTQVVFAAASFGLSTGKYLYLEGFTGADAALVNGLSHRITGLSGSGPYTFTLATDTYGKTITLGSGVGAAAERLEWAGEFDVPARFNSDWMSARHDQQLMSWPDVEIVEIGL